MSQLFVLLGRQKIILNKDLNADMKNYSVSLTLSVEAKNEEEAMAAFDRMVVTGQWKQTELEVEEE